MKFIVAIYDIHEDFLPILFVEAESHLQAVMEAIKEGESNRLLTSHFADLLDSCNSLEELADMCHESYKITVRANFEG